MRETQFIKNNQAKWKDYEELLEKEYQNPDKLNEIFIKVTDDLSYSRTFYKNRSVRVYLNSLAQKIFQNIYKNKRSPANRFANFWKAELPRLIYESRKDFYLSFLIFFGAFLIGAFSTAMDVEFPRIIMGDEYVDMTIENIKKGDPMAVYKEKGQFGMSVGITLNNLFVAFLTFVMGVFFAIGAIAILIRNGVMVGAFQYFFYEQGVFQESLLTIWMHGTLEISAIIIAGAAGITMGKGFVFPGTLSRIKSFQITARRGLKIIVGLIPIFIIAGFIEGYITRHTKLPDLLRGLFIFACLTFVLWYFVWYPHQKAKRGFLLGKSHRRLQPSQEQTINFSEIKSIGGLFADSFILYKKYFGRIGLAAGLCSIFYALSIFFTHQADAFSKLFRLQNIAGNLNQFFVHSKIPYLPIIAIAVFTIIAVSTYQLFLREKNIIEKKGWLAQLLLYLKAVVPVTSMYLLIYSGGGYRPLYILLLFPVIFLWLFILQQEQIWYIKSLAKTISLMGGAYMKLVVLGFLLLVISSIFYSLLDTSLTWFFVDIVNWNLPFKGEAGSNLLHLIMVMIALFTLFLLYPLLIISVGLYYFSQKEVKEANYLKAQIQQIGHKKEIRGMAMES